MVVDADARARGKSPARWAARTRPTTGPSSPGLDAVCVAVPTERSTFEVVRDCLEAGVHVLVEKPLARTLERGGRAARARARRRRWSCRSGTCSASTRRSKRSPRSRGRPLFIDIERLAPFKARGTDVDVILDLMIHDLDLALRAGARAGASR